MATAHYTFLPWYRTGLATAIDANPALGDRGQIDVTLKTKVGTADELSAPQRVRLIGPGDIIGIDPRAIVRLDPRLFANDFEPNYCAAAEFFDEDFLWRYSPRAPEGAGNARLLPWLALIVLEQGEFTWSDQGEGLPRAIKMPDASVLPPADELWAWAHTHLNSKSADPANPRPTADLLRGDPTLGCSRLVAARKLRPHKSYHGMLVPAFESGRRAGLLPGPAPDRLMAWDRNGEVLLPVYFEWTFRTGEEGDFEALARRLRPIPPDPTVGRRPMNVARPLPGMATPPIRNGALPSRPVLDLEGALQLPGAQPSPWEATSRTDFRTWLAEFINLGEVWTLDASKRVTGAPPLPNGIKLPIVLPPSYGRWHASIDILEPAQADARWLEEVNLEPRHRVAAAFGTLVVQKNQEDFMARAWAQYGDLFLANRYRYRAQFMREMLTATEIKHFASLAAPILLAATHLVHARVTVAGTPSPMTVRGSIEASALPIAAVHAVARRVLRDQGPIAKRFGTRATHLRSLVSDLASAKVAVAPALTQPGERFSLASRTSAPDATGQSSWLGGEWDLLRPRLVFYLEHTEKMRERVPALAETARLIRELLARGDAQSIVSTAALTPDAVREVRSAVDWIPPMFRDPTRPPRREDVTAALEDRNFSFAAWNFRQAAINATEWLTMPLPEPKPRVALDVNATVQTLRDQLLPYVTVIERVSKVVQLPPVVRVATYDPLEAIMAHPTFDEATYAYLKKISQEYVVPNLSKIANNSVTLLEANWRFIESYMVGLNHEMARELLWREYRTDRRGTYFAQFWDIKGIPGGEKGDIHPIHGWRRGGKLTVLGDNRPEKRKIRKNLVLVVRGDLLRRYPNTRVFAVRAFPNDKPRQREETFENFNRRARENAAAADVKEPILFASFEPDIYCFGFDLERDEARGLPSPERKNLGWYFVLAERFGEPRFGLDEPPASPNFRQSRPQSNDLTWADLVPDAAAYAALGPMDLTKHKPIVPPGGFVIDPDTAPSRRAAWATDSADMAAILLQTPFQMFFHANDMLLP